MKKIISAIVAALTVVILAVALTACGGTVDVKGKTFVVDTYEAELNGESVKYEGAAAQAAAASELHGATEFTFNEDGTMSLDGTQMGVWAQDGSTVTVKETAESTEALFKLSASGSLKLEEEAEVLGVKMSMTIKFKEKA